jgi:purine/pyrimidine-nucleoside phosphorylase
MPKFENATVVKKANVYFDGKCVSHTVYLPGGDRKTIGVIMPSVLTFKTDAPELIEITAGTCKVRLPGDPEWRVYRAGDSFKVPGKSSFDIEALETLDYVCHFE